VILVHVSAKCPDTVLTKSLTGSLLSAESIITTGIPFCMAVATGHLSAVSSIGAPEELQKSKGGYGPAGACGRRNGFSPWSARRGCGPAQAEARGPRAPEAGYLPRSP
jgi:hypothetical protein